MTDGAALATAVASFCGAAAGGVLGGLYGLHFIARRLPGAMMGLQAAPYEAPTLTEAWFRVDGDGRDRCRKCNVPSTVAGELPSCPACGFAGGPLASAAALDQPPP